MPLVHLKTFHYLLAIFFRRKDLKLSLQPPELDFLYESTFFSRKLQTHYVSKTATKRVGLLSFSFFFFQLLLLTQTPPVTQRCGQEFFLYIIIYSSILSFYFSKILQPTSDINQHISLYNHKPSTISIPTHTCFKAMLSL